MCIYALHEAIPGVECPQLQDPANGAVSQPNNVTGTIATYTCDPGFVLVGSETQMCMTDGTWSGQPPTCSESKQCHEYLYSLIDISYVCI